MLGQCTGRCSTVGSGKRAFRSSQGLRLSGDAKQPSTCCPPAPHHSPNAARTPRKGERYQS
eukprot:6183627-Pleurochrysis_carterae.AAC.2